MNYQKVYDQIIERAKLELNERLLKKQNGEYYEAHHIVPVCLGGKGDRRDYYHSNIALLFPREHFICHWLLCRIYPDNYKIIHAFWMMNICQSENQKRYNFLIKSSRSYQEAKEHRKKLGLSKETIEKRTFTRKQNGWFKNVEDFKNKIKATKEKNPYITSEKTKNKISLIKLGIPRKKIECPHCGKIGGDGNMQRWHLDNCKIIKKITIEICPHCKKSGTGSIMKRWHFDNCKYKIKD